MTINTDKVSNIGGVWTLAEQREGRVKTVSYELLARGRALADRLKTRLVSVVLGTELPDNELQELIRRGADQVLFLQDACLGDFVCESYAQVLAPLIEDYEPCIILAAATSTGRTLMPYLAVKVKAGLTADCTGLDIEEGTDNLLQTRPAIGGNILATIKTAHHRPQMATVRPRSTRPLPPDESRTAGGTETMESRGFRIIRMPANPGTTDRRARVVGYRPDTEGTAGIEEADIVVSGGKGLKKGENFSLIRSLAEILGGAVGASRDAVDRGWIGYAHQVGLSGKTISPRLYLCAGISGSIQHLAGIKTSETIVAVNTDPDANIHGVADFSIVGNLFDVLPELTRRLGSRSVTGKTGTATAQRACSGGDGAAAGEAHSHGKKPSGGRRQGSGKEGPVEASPAAGQMNDPGAGLESTRPESVEAAGAESLRRTASGPYKPVTGRIIELLTGIVGKRNVLTDTERTEGYSHDETAAEEFRHMPEVVVTPTCTEQVAGIVKLANTEGIPVTPRGAGSGLSGGAVPIHSGIVLSVEKMNRVIEIDTANMVAVAETGVVTNDLNALAAEKGLYYAGYPMSLQTCFLGGNIAENAGGGKAIKYGVTGRYILGMEVVTPTGEVVQLGGKLSKDVSGYDLKQLIIGSEGTLGIVTRAIVKLIGLPRAKADLLALFDTPRAAIDVVPVIMTHGIVPTSIEFMDRLSVETTCLYLNESLPFEHTGAMLLIEVDGTDAAQVEAELIAIGELCLEQGATEVYVAEDKNIQERIWNVRRNIAEAFKVAGPVQSLEDIVVPPAVIPEIIPELGRLSEKYRMRIPCYGHAGDGNLHATLVKYPEMSMDEWHVNEKAALSELYEVVRGLGGKISGEHGIGIKRRRDFMRITDPVEVQLMRGIKRAWDPNNIMNPGKIFDPEPAAARPAATE